MGSKRTDHSSHERSGKATVIRRPLAVMAALAATVSAAALPPVPIPVENPVTEPKRVLGKILFWDEQLSADNSIACGTCHRPAAGGSDPRRGRHPGADPGTVDDVAGSPGIASLSPDGQPRQHVLFGLQPQVTRRLSLSNFGALWADAQFWDGRAADEFHDPLSGKLVIAAGGSLETQTLAALANPAEMAKTDQQWWELTEKLAQVAPLALASDLPEDVAAALAGDADYADLFAAAFGDAGITPVRIAFAIASYERTLVADQTPWDRYDAGDADALNPVELYGLQAMQTFRCTNCHIPPLFTNNAFLNVGLRRSELDRGRQNVTGDLEDAGEVKVPSLRNVGLRPRFMHTGEFDTLGAAVSFYRTGAALPDRDDIPGAGIYAFNMSPLTEADIRSFLSAALTDPRVRDESFPFDRPMLRSERALAEQDPPDSPVHLVASSAGKQVHIAWSPPADAARVVDYVLERNGRVIAMVTDTQYVDTRAGAGPHDYRLRARNAARAASPPVEIRFRR